MAQTRPASATALGYCERTSASRTKSEPELEPEEPPPLESDEEGSRYCFGSVSATLPVMTVSVVAVSKNGGAGDAEAEGEALPVCVAVWEYVGDAEAVLEAETVAEEVGLGVAEGECVCE